MALCGWYQLVTNLLARVSDVLLDEVNQIGRSKLAHRDERFCSGVNRLVKSFLDNPITELAFEFRLALRDCVVVLGHSRRRHCDDVMPLAGGGWRLLEQRRERVVVNWSSCRFDTILLWYFKLQGKPWNEFLSN